VVRSQEGGSLDIRERQKGDHKGTAAACFLGSVHQIDSTKNPPSTFGLRSGILDVRVDSGSGTVGGQCVESGMANGKKY
jgi:hypothetical protein